MGRRSISPFIIECAFGKYLNVSSGFAGANVNGQLILTGGTSKNTLFLTQLQIISDEIPNLEKLRSQVSSFFVFCTDSINSDSFENRQFS